MATGAVHPGYSSTLMSMGDQSSAQAMLAIQSPQGPQSPSDVVSISEQAREAHTASDLFDSAGFSGPASDSPAPFQKAVAAVQYQQVQSLLETGTTSYNSGG